MRNGNHTAFDVARMSAWARKDSQERIYTDSVFRDSSVLIVEQYTIGFGRLIKTNKVKEERDGKEEKKTARNETLHGSLGADGK